MKIDYHYSVLVSTDKDLKLNQVLKSISQFAEVWSIGIETFISIPDNSRTPNKIGQIDLSFCATQEEAGLFRFTLCHIYRNMCVKYTNIRFRLINAEGAILDDSLIDKQSQG